MRNGFFFKTIKNCKGQSTVEYAVIVCLVFSMFLAAPSISDEFQTVFSNKSNSYAFSVAISEPPSSKVDEEVHEATSTIDDIVSFFRDFELPDDFLEDIPGYDTVEKFIDKIKSWF